MHIGDFRLDLINDGVTQADPGGPFGLVPRALYRRYFEPDENHQIPMTLHSLLVRGGDQTILIDTGLGFRMTEKDNARWGLTRPQGNVLDGLARLGVKPEDVTLVIDTHLHADHCSGNVRYEGDELVPTFPNAQYVTQLREYQDAIRPNERTAATYLNANWEPLIARDQLRFLEGDTVLLPGIMGVVTPGHTPGHMSVIIESHGDYAFFACDLASYAVHFERLAWMTAYDLEPIVTLETKRRWQKWASETKALVIFPHDPKRPAGRMICDEQGRFTLEAVDLPYA